MGFDGCELELKCTLKVDGKGKLKFHIVEAGGGVASESVSSIKLKFSSLGAIQPGSKVQAPKSKDDKKSRGSGGAGGGGGGLDERHRPLYAPIK